MDEKVTFTPEKAWLAAKGQLQMDLSRSSFDTWVKPASLHEFSDSTFVVGCPNEPCREWMTNRMTTTLERMLSLIMSQSVKISFILTRQPVVPPEQTTDGPIPCTGPEIVELAVEHTSLRNAVLEPNRVVKIPTYLFRWLPYVQSQTIFLVVAFWQEYYLSGVGGKKQTPNKVAARAEHICQWAGISRAHFFRMLQPGGPLEWFLRKQETEHELDHRTGRVKKSSNKYVLNDLPLTPGDADDLKSYLLSHNLMQSPVEALTDAIAVDPREILKYPYREPSIDFERMHPKPLSVQGVIQGMLGRKLDTELSALADKLAERLINRNDFIMTSWYFLKKWLPILGPESAMSILMLRNLCYFNDQTGEIRDEVQITGGYEEMARRLGMPNPRLISTWFPAKSDREEARELTVNTRREMVRRQGIQELIGQFIQLVERRQTKSHSYSLKFKVHRMDPLLPADEQFLGNVAVLLDAVEQNNLVDEFQSWVPHFSDACSETVKSDQLLDLRLSACLDDCPETLNPILIAFFETLEQTEDDCSETLLKILRNIQDSFLKKDTNPEPDSALRQNARAVAAPFITKAGDWSLEKLLQRVDGKNRETLVSQERNAQAYVSWVIYGASQPNINNPISLAIARLKENPGTGAGYQFERLASLLPVDMVEILIGELSFYPTRNEDWRSQFGGQPTARVRLLADCLGLRVDEEPFSSGNRLTGINQ
jgi:hypothetical protein